MVGRERSTRRKPKTRGVPAQPQRGVASVCGVDGWDRLCAQGYTNLAHNPEIAAGVDTIAKLIGSMTVHLMENSETGDVRVRNELSRKVDIDPCSTMTRSTFVAWIVRTLMLEGNGNCVVYPQTRRGLLRDLIPIPASLVSFTPSGDWGYTVYIAGREYNPDDVLHFVLNPSSYYPWMGAGYRVSLADVADERHIAFFYDVPPALKSAEAIAWDAEMGLKSRHARAYYAPYAANDQWRGGKTVWGVSGAMAAAKARCNKIVTVGSTPGVHYAPAGEKRANLTRTGLTALFPDDRINRDALYDGRINPILPVASGGCAADDDLTHIFQTNYIRFGWINDVLDYIDHRFYEGAQQVKFEPDGLTRTGLMDMTTAIMEELVTSGALVTPRDPVQDGSAPYIITVEQLEIDLWKVTWAICITGAARRIAGQPKLIR